MTSPRPPAGALPRSSRLHSGTTNHCQTPGRPITPTSDEALLAGARRLDQEALAAIHDAYYDRILRYVAFRVSDLLTAEDLTSDVFVRFLNAVHQGKAPHSTLEGWLYGTASNVVADHYRRRGRGQDVELERADEAAVAAADPARLAEEALAWHRLSTALRHLTDDQRQVLAMRYALDMPIRDVAKELGRSEGSVKQLQARAVARLADILAGEAVIG